MKKTGKVLSLVLSLALVASSLTATFASAGRSSKTATVTLDTTSITLANGGTGETLKSSDLTAKLAGISAELSDHSDVSTYLSLKDVVITSGSDKATLTKTYTDGKIATAYVTLKSSEVTGTVTLATRYQGDVVIGADDADDPTTVYGQSTFTVNIVKAGKAYITAGTAEDSVGDYPAALDTMYKNDGDSINGVVETAAAGANADAVWTAQPVNTDMKADAFKISTSGVTVTVTTSSNYFTITNKKAKSSDTFAATGSIAVVAQKYKSDTAVESGSDYRAAAKTSVKNVYQVAANETIISKYSTKTYIGDAEATKTVKGTDITGTSIDLTNTSTVEMKSGAIGDVTGATNFTVSGGTVGAVTATGAVTVSAGSVGAVTVDDTAATLKVTGGTVGAVSGDGTVTLQPADDATTVKAGNLSAKTIVIDSNDGIVTAGDITASQDDTAITLTGDAVTVGAINDDYRIATLSLKDFKGSIAAPSNAYTEGINDTPKYLTLDVNGETDATVKTAANLNAIVMSDAASLTFADKVKVGDQGATGDGVLKFAPNALYTTGDITTSIRMTKSFAKGDVIFTSKTDAVDESDFTPVGFTAEKVATSSTVDSFKVTDITFASINIVGSAKIAVGTTETYTAVNYPDSTKLPDGYKIQWTFDGNTDYLVPTADTKDSAKVYVKAVKEDKLFTSLNKGTLTATVVDADGVADDTYAPATFDVSIGTTAATYTSDTTGTLNLAVGQTYQFKITSSDGSVPPFVVANGGATVAAYTKSGNDYFFKVTGAKAGEYGVYVGGKVCTLNVTAASTAVKTDTTKVTIANGKTYQFKITASAKPTFVVASVGAILPASVNGNDYFYKVTNNGMSGDYGVYVNGAKIAVITFTK